VDKPGGRSRKTSEADDQSLQVLAIEHNWDDINQLRETDVFQDNPNLATVSNSTIRRRLEEHGIFITL
jgi:hypothetical protein